MEKQGLFIGLVTLDLAYLTTGPPSNNQKIVASDYAVAAGGPATNAAVAFNYLGNQATLLGVVGAHPVADLIRTDLQSYPVLNHRSPRLCFIDLDPTCSEPPPVSSIIVTEGTGERAIVSLNAIRTQVAKESIRPDILREIDIVLIDGHQMAVGQEIAKLAKSNDIPVVLDGGSWKPGFEKVLPSVNYAVCSANFYPPGCQSSGEVITYLLSSGIQHIAITHGQKPIQYTNAESTGWLEVPQTEAIDTTAAGDVFHGAFCHYILRENFAIALAQAANLASYSCQFFGTRRWLENYKHQNR
jgi:sugar/nucleoside kinase (ribokinase family)